MTKTLGCVAVLALFGIAAISAQAKKFVPITEEMLMHPSADDWLMLSRTHDQQRFSPLTQINRETVGQLRMVWTRGMNAGTQETTPIVHDGVMYVIGPGAIVQALDATNGDLLWEYQHKLAEGVATAVATDAKTKALSIYGDLIFYASPDGYLVALDARTGAVRWRVNSHPYESGASQSSAPIVADGKVMLGGSCGRSRLGCYIAAYDAATGTEAWRFYTTAAPGEPGGETWGEIPAEKRVASSWGLPGSYDPARKLVFWGTANPIPFTRLERYAGNSNAVSNSSPSELYSNSTLALSTETGKLAWYYQHLPGDDWDSDQAHERILASTVVKPDPKAVKWINPHPWGDQPRDIVITMPESGGIWALDRATGEFLWATPFPFDVPEFDVSKIDVETGKTYINVERIFKKKGDRSLVCYFNTKSYWSMSYDPGRNSLYIPYYDACTDMTAYGPRVGVPRPGSDPKAFAGIAKMNVSTGQIGWRYAQPVPGNGSVLSTAGNVLFWGDLDRRFRAFDADSGKVLWETVLGGTIMTSTITYAVNGRQYVAVLTGYSRVGTGNLFTMFPKLTAPRGHNAIYVFALPESR